VDPETRLRKSGVRNIAGVDESGRGPLAGPVVAAAVILKEDFRVKGLRDAKEMSLNDRLSMFIKIIEGSKTLGISIVDSRTIDQKNILQASLYAMKEAVSSLDPKPKHVIVDGNQKIPKLGILQTTVIAGDKICRSVSSASVIAKVVRDEIMHLYDRIYPNYGFVNHKGYGTKEHLEMLVEHGPVSIHRLSYQPVIDALTLRGIIII